MTAVELGSELLRGMEVAAGASASSCSGKEQGGLRRRDRRLAAARLRAWWLGKRRRRLRSGWAALKARWLARSDLEDPEGNGDSGGGGWTGEDP